jgi:hypothetical protein
MCNDALFARWDKVEHMSYLAGLYDNDVEEATQVQPYEQDWDYMVIHWNDGRISKVAFVGSDLPRDVISGSGHV